jgi:hypothetical protein
VLQFAGFPRSGHSVVGSLIDSHPQALVAHELDAMGLFEAGFAAAEVFALMRMNSAAFEAAGRWWNGYCYAVPEGHGGRADPPRVIGDKKGDWAVRRILRDPRCLDRYNRAAKARRRCWIVVVRNPFDNVASLSLRKGRVYDRLRVQAGSEQEFRRRLEQAKGETIASAVLPDMVDDYRELCSGIAALKDRVAADDWLELHHEDLVDAPEREIGRVLQFLDLPDGGFARRAASVIGTRTRQTRHDVEWPESLYRQVIDLTHRHDFLNRYAPDV